MTPRDAHNTWTSDALLRGDTIVIRSRVREDLSYLHERDFVGATPLLNAIAFGDLGLVQFLLAQGADPNVVVDDGYTCLLTAIESKANDATAMVAELIQAGADIHATGTNGWTPLHMAAACGHLEKARLLLDAGADVNRRTEIDGCETPLMVAARQGQPATVQLLLAYGADPSLRDTVHGQTARELAEVAARGPDPNVVSVLQQANAQVDVGELCGNMDLSGEQLEMIRQATKGVDLAQSYIDNARVLAKTGNHAEVIRILSAHGP